MKRPRHTVVRVMAALSALLVTVLAIASCAPAPVTSTVSGPTTTSTTTSTATVTPAPVTQTVTAPPVTTTVVPTSPPPSGPAIPPEVTQYAADWPLPQGDYAATRATFSSTINSSNVNTLGVAWTMPLKGSTSTNPIIMGNNVFLQDNSYNIWSVDFNTGKQNWYVGNNHPWIGPVGVAVGWGKVFGSLNSYDLAALDMNTGKQIWDTNISNINQYLRSDIQPLPYGGQVYTSDTFHVTYDIGSGIGYMFALDQATGKVNWSFSGVDDPNMWDHPEINSGGGAWFPPSVDVKTGTIFWGTKNPGSGSGPSGPYAGNAQYPNGYSRPGPNLYTNSILAMDSSNGKLLWYNQTFPHDLMDHDFMNTPMLVTAPNIYGWGGPLDIAIGGGKAGVVYAFDRASGATLWSTPVGKHQNDTLGFLPANPTLQMYPGVLGGIESHMAYANGMVFAPYDDLWSEYTSTGLAKTQPIGEGTGGLAALDVNTGKILWDAKFPSLDVGAATVVNDLVFTSTYDGTIYALKASDGSQVWSWKGPGGLNSWPAVARDTIIFPFGVGANPMLVALRLGATGTIPTPPSPTPAPTPTPSGKTVNITVTAQNIAFDTSMITAPAGATVTITFINNDAQVPHNIAFYTDSSASTVIYRGATITGPAATTYTFTAPNTPGSYFFRCDVHPTLMTGTFMVTAQ